MKRAAHAGPILFILVCMISGCTSVLRSETETWPRIGDEFAKALRWGEPGDAANFAAPQSRDALRALFPDDDSLKVVDASHSASGPERENEADGSLYVEYYRLASPTLRKATLPIGWSCVAVAGFDSCRWRISSLPSRLP